MPVNLDKPQLWKADVTASVDLYNTWFMQAAPEAFRTARARTAAVVLEDLRHTRHLADLSPATLRLRPGVVRVLRMATAPPIALDRLVGLAGVSRSLVATMEGSETKTSRLPPRIKSIELDLQLARIGSVIKRLTDDFIFPWLARGETPSEAEEDRAAAIVADRLCGTLADPIVRNAQEKRQLALISSWLTARGYSLLPSGVHFDAMPPGTFSFRLNVPVQQANKEKTSLGVKSQE